MTFEEDEDEGVGFIRSVKERVKVETELQHLQTLIQDMQKVSKFIDIIEYLYCY